MANGDGKQSPFNPDGRSGAVGNDRAAKGFGHLTRGGTSGPPQRMGSGRNPASVARGGPFLTSAADAPDREGQVGTTADPAQRRPFKLGGAEGPAGSVPEELQGPGVVGVIPPEPDGEA